MKPISPCLWFDDQAEEAANFYCSIFKNSRITDISRYTEAGREFHHQQPGTVMTVAFEINGQQFTALNGGPVFQFSEAVSFQVHCDDQTEIDYYWEKLSAGGDVNAQNCGWLKDKFGVSWQIVPSALGELLKSDKSQQVMNALLKMKRLNIAALAAAAEE